MQKKITKAFILFAGLFLLGIVCELVAAQLNYIDVNGVVHDSLLMPAGALLMITGVVGIVFSLVFWLYRRLSKGGGPKF